MEKERHFVDSQWDEEQQIYASPPVLADYGDEVLLQLYMGRIQHPERTPFELAARPMTRAGWWNEFV